jgi:hypothetical protein
LLEVFMFLVPITGFLTQFIEHGECRVCWRTVWMFQWLCDGWSDDN